MKINHCFILALVVLGNIFCATNSTNSTNSTTSKNSDYIDQCTNKQTNSEDECFNSLQEEEKNMDLDCCLVKYKSGSNTYSYCDLISDDEKSDYKKNLEYSGKESVVVICSKTKSLKNYMNFSLLILFLILL